ncbi:MAG: hypothetical protein JNM07_08240 [Phycisphaerae bacterium]|nr:hypothetical protein [Phycisphaerae bacterium]
MTHGSAADQASNAAGGRGDGETALRDAAPPKDSIKETLISTIIAFVLAFVFRGFVIEAFIIPTGSMAPTLMGAHMRFRSPESGAEWAVGPWFSSPATGEPLDVQGANPNQPVVVHDPMTGLRVEGKEVPRLSGDRILVLKYLYALNEPKRFDVVVFKNPSRREHDKQADGDLQNFIKRLIGLPGEQVALVDGDVFTRKMLEQGVSAGRVGSAAGGGSEEWNKPGWTVARKPVGVQREVWQTVFDSAYSPLNPERDGRRWFTTPWAGEGPGWSIDGRRVYEWSGGGVGATVLRWDSDRPFVRDPLGSPSSNPPTWEIVDRYAYDEIAPSLPNAAAQRAFFPVSDLRLRAGVEPTGEGLGVACVVLARGHEFRADLQGTGVALRMRAVGGEWKELARGSFSGLRKGVVSDVEFWHVDQSLQVWIDGSKVCEAAYEWGPAERILHSTGRRLEDLVGSPGKDSVARLANEAIYRKPGASWGFSGAGVRLHRVALDRDLFYQPAMQVPQGVPGLGTHPARTVTLGDDQFFVCGDNSPASADGRLWTEVDPWVAAEIDAAVGVVNRELMLGKAFFVYFPAPTWVAGRVPVPDFGRMRFIR